MTEILKAIELIEDKRQEKVEIFAKSNEEFLKQYIELENGIPPHDTMQRVMGSIAPEYMQNVYKKWNGLVNSNEGETLKKIICIDGKTMRGNKSKEQKANHIVSAWCDMDGFCLKQKTVEEESNEVTAVPQLLDTIQVKGSVVTIDAMGTQTEIAEKIKQKQADYTLAVKENQKNLYMEISEYFEDDELLKELKSNNGYKVTKEKAHSQIETREYYQCDRLKWMREKSR